MALVGRRLRNSIFFQRARKRAIEELTTKGFGLIGMAHPAISQEEATRLVAMVDDETLEHNLKDIAKEVDR